jgi:aryl-alcohol dehydrogenase
MKTRAAVVKSLGEEFVVQDIEIGEPLAGEVLVKVAAVGLCHTDLAAQHGHLPFPLPGVLGHEGAGTVVSVGEGVTKVRAGDKVAISFNNCGECTSCTSGEPAYCRNFMALNFAGVRPDGTSALSFEENGVGAHFFGQSSFAEHAIATERNVVVLPDDYDVTIAGPLGCGIQTGAGAVMNTFDLQPGQHLLVLGGGSVGMAAALAGAVRSLASTIVVEPLATRRQLALELGATHVVDPAAGPIADQVRAIVPEGVDAVIDTTANAEVMQQGFSTLRTHGRMGIIAVPADPTSPLPVTAMAIQLAGASVVGIVEGDSNPDKFIPELVRLHQEGRFPFDQLVTKVPFARINEAIALQAKGEAIKVVLVHD